MYEAQTYENILERMLNRVSDKIDKREGSVIWDTHSPTAIELQILYIELDNLIKEAYGDTASREFLILRCHERGIYPYEASNAVLKGVFTPTNIDLVGKRFNISDLNYIVTEKIQNGVYQVKCETSGIVGNQYLGNMLPIDYIDGLETAELTQVLIPGEDAEDTESLRERYFNSFGEFAFGGNRADYIAKVKSINGVGGVKVERVWNGNIKPSDMYPNSTVRGWYNSYVSSMSDTDVKQWLTAVFTAANNKYLTVGGTVGITIVDADDYGTATPTLINSVQTELDPIQNMGEGYGLAPIGHVVTVQSATAVLIQIHTNISYKTGQNFNTLKEDIENAIKEYLLNLRKNWENTDCIVVRISQIEARILSVEGIVDVYDTTINGNADNLTLSKYEIPIFGGVTDD